ncbi:sugar phosphate isomerase/epimerase [Agriterribacter sp.]|uniref:sugar phosphate isomerase/epimerase family protein n=1 Tax=Agriterribacter sp. TaxID=2821509 RepID=UPI002BCFDCC5|nr:sugar phosphate isomerase/epimerase [Agriterribacter sp.]HRO44982.1 sugar phosphate isomerase/epimerase [Agriterribacter sp.]HRQ15719.1 sugar phosphate isomerase/epimerase [Agriterribacter sp.]
MKRRNFIGLGTAAGIAAGSASLLSFTEKDAAQKKEKRYQKGVSPWPICLDTATIRPASLTDKVKIAAKAGFDAIEPWDGELAEYEKNGGSLKDLGKQIRDLGLFVPSVIGLWNALPPTQELFDASLKDTRRRMRMASDIGAQHIQTIPNTVGENFDRKWVAARYRDIIEIGLKEYNIQPALVFVKFFPLKTLGQAVGIALDANHPKAMVIPDVYHMYISEGGFESIKLMKGDAFAIFQFNDAPATPALAQLEDKHRVYPGDGILPLTSILRDLKGTGFKGCVSLEMYNPEYWKQDLQRVAETGFRKTLEVIRKAGV